MPKPTASSSTKFKTQSIFISALLKVEVFQCVDSCSELSLPFCALVFNLKYGTVLVTALDYFVIFSNKNYTHFGIT